MEFCDGSVIAQMGSPDMTLPIAYALSYPNRPVRDAEPLDLPSLGELTFRPCTGRFARAVNLGYAAVRRGGLAGAVLNSGNEAAVTAFLDGKISFGQIVPMVEEVMNLTPPAEEITHAAVIEADAWARKQVAERIGSRDVQKQNR